MKRSLVVVAALAILTVPMVVCAAPVRPGPYVSGFIGVTAPQNSDATFTQFGPSYATFSDRIEYDPSVNIGGTGGYDFGFVRLEGELSYKHGDITNVTTTDPGGVSTRYVNIDGSLGVLAMMFNCFIDLHNDTPVTPYFGGGAGFAALYLDDTYGTVATGPDAGIRRTLYVSDDDSVFAYQVGGGLEIALTRQLSLDLAYRYFGTTDATFNDNWNTETRIKYESHNGTVGIRVKF